LTPAATWVLTRGRHPDLLPEPAKVLSPCVADEPVPKALLTPTVTLVLDSAQRQLVSASIRLSVARGLLRRRNPPLSCAAAGRAAVVASKASVRLIARGSLSVRASN
jgi:hypothetical protein